MSLGKQKNLIILGAVAAALLVGGVLVADYADVLPGRAKTGEQAKLCTSGETKACCTAEAATAGFPQVMAASEAAPAQACCGAEKPAGGCGEPAGGCGGEPAPGKSCCPSEAPKRCCGEPEPCDAPAVAARQKRMPRPSRALVQYAIQ